MKYTDVLKKYQDGGIEPCMILETYRAGEVVDNGYGMDFEIHQFHTIIKEDTWDHKLCDIRIDLDDSVFTENCLLEGIIEEFASDGFEIKYRREWFKFKWEIKEK